MSYKTQKPTKIELPGKRYRVSTGNSSARGLKGEPVGMGSPELMFELSDKTIRHSTRSEGITLTKTQNYTIRSIHLRKCVTVLLGPSDKGNAFWRQTAEQPAVLCATHTDSSLGPQTPQPGTADLPA